MVTYLMQTKKLHIIGFIFVLFAGILLHFTYKLSGQNSFVAYFSAVNESVWEHLKLIFFPALIFSVCEYFVYGKHRADFWAVKMTAILSALCFIVAFFYTYSGVLGFTLVPVDILSFVIADFICFYLSWRLLNLPTGGDISDSIKGIAVLLLLLVCFVIWTNNPPDIGIFWG